jgi:hypothetical protein
MRWRSKLTGFEDWDVFVDTMMALRRRSVPGQAPYSSVSPSATNGVVAFTSARRSDHQIP